jgi:SOS response regulatory protein OraA/RecX
LRAELARLGVEATVAREAAAAETDSAAEDAYRAAARRASQLAGAGADERAFRTRLGQFLARRGFDWDTIGRVVERLWRDVSTS